MKILLAEDERDLQEVVVAYLEYQGYHVTAVDNGAKAVEKANSDAYDAIVMDIMMPVMDGIAAMKRIRASGNTVPAIFLTAKAEVSDRIEGLDAGADDYLRKYRIIEWFSSGGNFSRLRTAKIEGYLAGNRDFCRQQAAEIHPLMGREHCAVFP